MLAHASMSKPVAATRIALDLVFEIISRLDRPELRRVVLFVRDRRAKRAPALYRKPDF